MAGFRPAKPEQAFLKMGLYGKAGTGKTFTALLLAEGLAKLSNKKVAFVDTERGTDFYAQKVESRTVHPEAFQFDAMYTRSVMDVIEAVSEVDPREYACVVIDSITHIWEACLAAYSGKTTKIGTIPMHAWGKIKAPYKNLMKKLLFDVGTHVIICGREGNEYDDDEETGELKMVGTKMKAEGETGHEPHILIRMEHWRGTNGETGVAAFAKKDRTGILALKTIVNPTFDTLCKPILHLLGGTQAKLPDSDSTASHDAEKLAEQELEKEARSADLFDHYDARIKLARTKDELKTVQKELTPEVKQQIGTDRTSQLRERYLEMEKKLA